jgi:V8-like Glu-specific endopeptidase
MRKIGRYAAILAGMLASVHSGCAAPADPFIAAIASMKRSIVPVICVKPHAANERFTPIVDGTGFFTTRSGEFLTAAHVVRDFSSGGSLQGCAMGVWFTSGSDAPGRIQFQMFPMRRCALDNDADIARCATDDLSGLSGGKSGPLPVKIDSSTRPDGSPIAVSGYPLSSLLPITSRGFIGGYIIDSRDASQIILDRAAWPGGSGSPVYDAHGSVLGLVTKAGEGAASGISFARSASTIVHFLSTHPLPPAKVDHSL